MLEGTLAAFAGLGFFLAGLHMLSEAVRALAARKLRLVLARVSRLPFGNALAGSMLGSVTQSTSASAFICIGLLNARAVSFTAALSISAWASVGTSILVFLASVDLRSLALLALSVVGMLLAANGWLTPVAGAVAQEAIDVVAVLNALRVALPPKQLTDFG